MKRDFYWLLLALATLPFMISTQSLWIDEAQTATYATAGSFRELFAYFSSDSKSEALMPLSMTLSWIFAQFLGTSEIALRLPNLIYLALGIVFIWRLGCALAMPFTALLFAVHPYVWQYAGEARPYALQISLGAGLIAATYFVIHSKGQSFVSLGGLVISGWLLSASSLLAVLPWVGAASVVIFLWWRQRWSINKWHWLWACITLACFLPLGIFYLYELQKGAAGAKIWDVGLPNLFFSAYEFLGFQGLGPSRSALREAARVSGGLPSLFLPYLMPILALGIALLAGGFQGRIPQKEAKASRNLFFFLVFLLASTTFLLFALALVAGFPFWGRHLAPLLPGAVFLIAIWVTSSKRAKIIPAMLISIGLLWLLSALDVRFSQRFAKDDYRGAAMQANTSILKGGTVWWAADTAGAHYYAVPIKHPESDLKGVYLTANPTEAELVALPSPDTVILSKADIYDNSGSLQEWLRSHGYLLSDKLQSFSVYSRPE
jgi:hypothetical protein